MISYRANRIVCEEVDGVLIVGVGNETDGYIMFQRGTTSETGADEPPYFEFNDQSNGGTGILQLVTINGEQLLIKTNSASKESEFEISLGVTAEDITLLITQLRLIFLGYDEKLHVEIT